MRRILMALIFLPALAGCAAEPVPVPCCALPDRQTDVAPEPAFYPSPVFFAYDSSDIDSGGRAALDEQIAWLTNRTEMRVRVEGHCDERGSREYNLALGERRAAAVKAYLVAGGIDPERIDTISYGKERPATIEPGEAGWARNRRAETWVIDR